MKLDLLIKVLFIFTALLLVSAGLLLLFIAVLALSAMLVSRRRQYRNESRWYRFLLTFSTGLMVFFLKIKLNVKGLESIPREYLEGKKRFLLVCNHRSKFDPLLTWYVLRHCQLVFISKPENFKIPIFGKFIHRLRFIPIERDSIASSMPALKQGTALLKSGTASVAVYPEGTRSLDCTLLPFHAVVFSLAAHSDVPVAVMTITGTETIRKKAPWKRSTVNLTFTDFIGTEWIKEHGTRELAARAELNIKNNLTTGEQHE